MAIYTSQQNGFFLYLYFLLFIRSDLTREKSPVECCPLNESLTLPQKWRVTSKATKSERARMTSSHAAVSEGVEPACRFYTI